MTRDDLELLDTPSLRALARKHLPGRSKSLHSRAALLTALAAKLLEPVVPATRRPRKPSPKADRTAGGQLPTSAARVPVAPHAASVPSPAAGGGLGLSPPEEVLVEEGFFVLHAQQRRRSRRAVPVPVARRAPPPPAERPWPLGEEVPHLLARDPTTLFLFWDFQRDLERGAAFGLDAPHVLFRLYRGETLVRTVQAPLSRRSLYLGGLEPGDVYSVEAWLQGSDGHARPTGRRSAPLRLPPAAPSAQLEVRLVRVPWEQPLGPQPVATESGHSLPAPGRVDLPASLQWRGGPGPGGPRSGRP